MRRDVEEHEEDGERCASGKGGRAEARYEAEVVCVFGAGVGDGAGERVGREPGIGVEEGDPISVEGCGAEVEGVALAEPAVGEGVDADDAETGVAVGGFACACGGVVGGAVVDEDEFEVDVLLSEESPDGACDAVGFVARGDDDADARECGGRVGEWGQRGDAARGADGEEGEDEPEGCGEEQEECEREMHRGMIEACALRLIVRMCFFTEAAR